MHLFNMEKFIIFVYCTLYIILGDASEHIPKGCPNIVSRRQWGARKPTFVDYTVAPLDIAIIHHTVTDWCDSEDECSRIVRSIQEYQMTPAVDFGDIGYNFLVGGDGNVYEGRGWHKHGAHLVGYNAKSIGIAFIGSFTTGQPTEAQIEAGKALLHCAVQLRELTKGYKLYGARQLMATEDPGTNLYNQIKQWPHFAYPDEEE